jgi:putative transposase
VSRISSSERLAQLAESLRSGGEAEDLTGEVIRLGTRRAIQELLEQEVSEILGRERYERKGDQSGGYHNGHKLKGHTGRWSGW